jgi:hypothetical protein
MAGRGMRVHHLLLASSPSRSSRRSTPISCWPYAGSKKAAEDVGFYYAANAGGRLFGIVLSGVLTQAGGLPACLWGSAVMLALCLALVFLLLTEARVQHGAMAAAE